MKKYLMIGTTLLLASCGTSQLPQPRTETTKPVPPITNLVEVRIEGATASKPVSTARVLNTAPGISKQGPVPIASGLSFKSLGTSSFTIAATGKRYLAAVFQVTNNTGRTLNNLGFVTVNLDDKDADSTNNGLTPTVGSTAFSKVKYYDGSDASSKAPCSRQAPSTPTTLPTTKRTLTPPDPPTVMPWTPARCCWTPPPAST
ncbi:hypothetical protein [Deinococcus cellulosilyticus]|uniref:Uncharacterized protein n=1 Tax=Deinococcus cellulosilyticus (strain DSM 18568 / NBRC 106333 / KACC 11606 / 5516J-15) TaxID=1223518 RepID=A0A511NAM4_DEIC1|nr:hypothetical protein [Deinococcus cellulosilyticus]GEM49596.1 hypothetical protein DC3_52310 [Deinococcus cellulosilyticus NBRC 106333 = KACC 11606]